MTNDIAISEFASAKLVWPPTGNTRESAEMVNMRAGLPRLGTVCDEYRLGDRRDSISLQASRSVTYPGSGHAHVSAQLLHGLLGLITTSNIRI